MSSHSLFTNFSQISENISEVCTENKVYCFLENINGKQDIVDPYEFREASDENNDHIALGKHTESHKSLYYIPYLERLDSTPFEDKLKIVTKPTNDIGKLQKLHNKEQTCPQYNAESMLDRCEKKRDEDSNNNIELSHGLHTTNNDPLYDMNTLKQKAELTFAREDAKNSKIQILDYKIFPAASITEPINNTNNINTLTSESNQIYDTISSDGISDDSYLDKDYNPGSSTSYCTSTTVDVTENISHNEDNTQCIQEDTACTTEGHVSKSFLQMLCSPGRIFAPAVQ